MVIPLSQILVGSESTLLFEVYINQSERNRQGGYVNFSAAIFCEGFLY